MSDESKDHSAAQITWLNEPPSAEIIAKVREDIAEWLGDLDEPEQLIFHVVSLTKDRRGPTVVLSGRDGGGFNATYEPEYEPIEFPLSDLSPEAREKIEAVMDDDSTLDQLRRHTAIDDEGGE